MLLQGLSKGGAGEADGVVADGSTETFARDVIEASRTVPVIVDFWAPWCGPCKQLTPLLEKMVRGAGGKVRLVKINVDDNQQLAAQLRIQSIPTVYAFAQGQPVGGFAGAQPESQVRTFVERLTGPLGPGPVEQALEQAEAAAALGQVEAAATLYQRVLQAEPDNPKALGGFARCQLATGRLADARATLDAVPAEHANHTAVAGAKAALALAEEAGDLPNPESLRRRLDANADDHDARIKLAMALFLTGNAASAMDELLQVIKRDRGFADDGARRQMVRFFEALGPSHPETVAGRRKLSSVLFS